MKKYYETPVPGFNRFGLETSSRPEISLPYSPHPYLYTEFEDTVGIIHVVFGFFLDDSGNMIELDRNFTTIAGDTEALFR